MIRRRVTLATALAVLLLSTAPTAGGASTPAKPGDIRDAQQPIPGQYIVTLKPNADVSQNSQRLSREHNARVKHTYRRALKGFSAQMSEDDALALSQDPAVESVEEDAVVTASTTQPGPPWGL